jgi:hypothetical protein
MEPWNADPICTLSGKAGLGISSPLIKLILYFSLPGEMLRTLINMRVKGLMCLPGSIRQRVGKSRHRMAENLRALGLQDAKPAFTTHSQGLQLRLNAGAALP